MPDRKPSRHRFPLSQRDVQELLFERGIVVGHETLRQRNIPFALLLTEELRHRDCAPEMRRPPGSFSGGCSVRRFTRPFIPTGLWGHGAALRELPVLHGMKHVQVASAARCHSCHNLIGQSHRPTRQHQRQHLDFRRRRTQDFLALHARVSRLHRHTRTTVPAPSDETT